MLYLQSQPKRVTLASPGTRMSPRAPPCIRPAECGRDTPRRFSGGQPSEWGAPQAPVGPAQLHGASAAAFQPHGHLPTHDVPPCLWASSCTLLAFLSDVLSFTPLERSCPRYTSDVKIHLEININTNFSSRKSAIILVHKCEHGDPNEQFS